MVWFKMPVLVVTNIAGNVLKSPSKYLVLTPQTRPEMA